MVSERFPDSYERFDRYFYYLCEHRLEDYDPAKHYEYREYVNTLSCTDQLIYDLRLLISQVENGLLLQWMLNSFGDRYDFTVDHLHKIGAFKARDILLDLKKYFPDGNVPFLQDERDRILTFKYQNLDRDEFLKFQEEFREPSDRLLDDCEDLYGLAIQYLESLGYDEEYFMKAKPSCW